MSGLVLLFAQADPFWIEAAKQVPALAVLVGLVLVFLKHLQTEGAANREVMRELGEVVRENSGVVTELRLELHNRSQK